ncbi:hypothetical protein [Sabulicella glaciei]|uniref:Uncharacterized protein n=1 Tax=Sabulicella glaciei TaxID=2984948 RepID=A0ABT3NUE8_9PROT|nr:hypothetical protein [Roseococcus sp. MDT2-1-1]MCW8085508.1 hypothetical protein [Roseococcus sp. MDT2-1-1]
MMKRVLAFLLALAPLAAAAQAPQARCWIDYAGFEERVPHLDIERCPGNDPTPEQGFCRIALQENSVLIYVFRHDQQAGGPCLVRIDRQYFNDFVGSQGTIYGP